MCRLLYFHKKTISYDLIIKLNFINSYQIPIITKINLNLSSVGLALNKKKILSFLLILELITGKKSKITLSKKNKINLKIKKNTILGSKISLNKKESYNFLDNLIIFILPNIIDFKEIPINNSFFKHFSFTIKNILNFLELKNEFLNFSDLPLLNITINIQSITAKHSKILLSSYNFPIK